METYILLFYYRIIIFNIQTKEVKIFLKNLESATKNLTKFYTDRCIYKYINFDCVILNNEEK